MHAKIIFCRENLLAIFAWGLHHGMKVLYVASQVVLVSKWSVAHFTLVMSFYVVDVTVFFQMVDSPIMKKKFKR